MATCHSFYQWILLLIYLASCTPSKSAGGIIYQEDIIENGVLIDRLEIRMNEEPADAVYAFGLKHSLDEYQRSILLDVVCKTLNCNRMQAIVWSTPVSQGGTHVGNFVLYENIEPVDAAHDFVSKYNLAAGYRHAILSEACEIVECHRIQPVIWRKQLNIDGNFLEIILKEGEELADVVFATTRPYNLSFQHKRKIMEEAKKDGVVFSREHALVFSKDIALEDKVLNETLKIFDDGQEPIDVLYEFSNRVGLDIFQQLSDSIMPEICQHLLCRRMEPIIWSHSVAAEDGRLIGELEITLFQEPIDAVDLFTRAHGLNVQYRENILRVVCENVNCTRTTPVVFKKKIYDEKRRELGTIMVFEGEEVIDAIVRFLTKTKADIDSVALKNHFFQHACNLPRLKCTRNVAHIFDRQVTDEDGSEIGRLVVTENDEPADKIYQWCKEKQLEDNYFYNILQTVCDADEVICNRRSPVVFSLPISGPEGEIVGIYEVKLNEEPVDAMYGFFASHGLFEKEWDFQGVVEQVCRLSGIVCNRKIAVKYYAENFIMGDTNVGTIIVLENEEVVDKLFEKRIHFNLTVHDQMKSFGEICSKKNIYCGRTQAVIFKLSGITKKDYEKFGNETCSRKYAGWQFLTSYSATYLGSKISKFIQKKYIEIVSATGRSVL